MCGIAGFVNLTRHGADRNHLARMLDVIAHRGPDGHGIHQEGNTFLGHRRLSIVDLDGGHQPMSNEDRSVWITFNGEIFNHAALRPALEQSGHFYQSRCDTETIVHAYEQHGPDCVKLLRGMFAFAVLDRPRHRLLCVRDRLGIKPLYYFANQQSFVFASEIKAVLAHPAVTTAFDESVLAEYLTFGYVAGDRTFFRNIRKLMPGHHLTLDTESGICSISQYWNQPEALPAPPRPDAEWIADCRARLEESVRMRLMSDVPLGMFLSGGVDSSAIAALMKRLRREPVKTFAVGYQEAAWSELGYARQVATSIGTDHHEVVVGSHDFFSVLPKLIWQEDEPIAWPSSVSLYFVSKLASEHVKVVLTGEGSDELFGGYYRYQHYLFNRRWADRYRFLPGPLRSTIRTQIAGNKLLSADLRRKLQHTFLGRHQTVESLQLDNFYGAFSASERSQMLLSHPAEADRTAYQTYVGHWNARSGSTLDRMLYADQKTYLVELLMKQDNMSMACSLESRVPFLDHTFVEFSTRVPDHLKLRGHHGKYLIKRAVEDLLPRDIIYRPKMGFPTPLRDWFRNPASDPLFSSLLNPNSFISEYIDLGFVSNLVRLQRNGSEDATDRLWRLLNLQLWGEIYIQGKRDPNDPIARTFSAPAEVAA